MKNSKWISATLASALLVTAGAGSALAASAGGSKTGTVSAAVSGPVKVKEGTATWTVNGTPVTFNTIDSGGYKLYALSQVAGEIGAHVAASASGIELNDSKGLHTLQIKSGSKSFQVDGEAQTFTIAPVTYKNSTYVELTKLVVSLGGELDAESTSILSFARPEGQFDTLHWAADGTVIANQSDAEATQLLKFGGDQGNYQLFSTDDSAVDFAVSADQRWGAFNDSTGQLRLIDLNSGAIKALGKDSTVKTDLVWSKDGKKIYFIQGDKQESISSISVETGTITSVLADKVENKSELRVSADEKSVAYIVNLTGVAKNDADSTEDSLTVDYSKAGEQLYSLDLTVKGAKAVALTTSADNKLYPEILADGNVAYLSADADGKAANTLKSVKADGTSTNIALDVEPTWVSSVNDGLVVSGTTADGATVVYSINASGAKTELYRSTEDVSEVAVSKDGSKLAIISDGKVVVIKGGKALELTK
ncbi:hypothetical protein A8L34_21205 [Bacillus sp. FJAT-27264]|uniref:PD40 domain-containing protein n=1 Tax=Paenibacillus sp. (strain DSM 101736 / FJAT-27264) TaxID=1850362 RepID=UPI000807EB5D|nr:PD40 domain-containing protein [Bacillus sp. FJAT-27264]OBZ09793.1 hypothetical protein A8L34_21205 [Bacillus sp. FJAT-27264]